MAKVHRLAAYDDLSLIGRYAERFGLDPDHVYHNTSFDTLIEFTVMWKESDEFQERYTEYWSLLNKTETEGKKE